MPVMVKLCWSLLGLSLAACAGGSDYYAPAPSPPAYWGAYDPYPYYGPTVIERREVIETAPSQQQSQAPPAPSTQSAPQQQQVQPAAPADRHRGGVAETPSPQEAPSRHRGGP